MTWNGERFSIYTSEEKQVLGLIKELGEQTNYNTDNLENKTDKTGNHEGAWQGLNKPTLSDEGMRATVEKHIADIKNINDTMYLNNINITKKLKLIEVNVCDYGAKSINVEGFNNFDSTQAFKNAIAYLNTKTNLNVVSEQVNCILKIPTGEYIVSDTIEIIGSIHIQGEGSGSYGGSIIKQKMDGDKNLFIIKGEGQEGNNATKFSNITFLGDNIKNGVGSFITYDNTIKSINSIYFFNCWFRNPSCYSLDLKYGDDIKIVNCTFDVSWARCIRLGANDLTTNVLITGNTFYAINFTHIEILNCKNAIISNNRFYGRLNLFQGGLIIDMNTNVGGNNIIENILFTSNVSDEILQIISGGACSTKQITISNNIFNNCHRVITLGNVKDHLYWQLNGNTINGQFLDCVNYMNDVRMIQCLFTNNIVNSLQSYNTPFLLMPKTVACVTVNNILTQNITN